MGAVSAEYEELMKTKELGDESLADHMSCEYGEHNS